MFFVLFLYILAYVLILYKPKVSSVSTLLLGSISMFLLNQFDFEKAGRVIDFNTLSILFGMMLIVSVLKERGVFTGISEYIIKASKGNFITMLILINIAIFFLSAFLDNVTTILIFIPILFYISDTLNLDPKMLSTNAILFSNIGGMTTAIGDPPNIVIYSVSKLPFTSFFVNLLPVGTVLLITQLFWLKKELKLVSIKIPNDNNYSITNSSWIWYLCFFMTTILTMAFHDKLNMELGTVTLLYALILLFIENSDFHSKVQEIDWDTIFLIVGLYMLNWSLESLSIFDKSISFFKNFQHSVLLPLIILWFSILLSGFLGALPVTLIFVNIVRKLAFHNPSSVLYWALALGVGIGGNLTPVASMCNIVGNNLLRKLKNEELSFLKFTQIMLKPVLYGGIISTVFILIKWYLRI
ncbi:MAG: SLC13 family permease [Fervidobacterium sp.]|nr:SLC13 family permease [Fervidobacterium sp.]